MKMKILIHHIFCPQSNSTTTEKPCVFDGGALKAELCYKFLKGKTQQLSECNK